MHGTHKFDQNVLKFYDIRGIVNKELTEKDAYFVGRSYGSLLHKLNKKTCIVGYDGRITSETYCHHVCKGLNETGINTTNIGLCPTPMVYFAVQQLKKDAGLIITASHNPPEFNGFKMLTNDRPIWGNDIQDLGRIAASGHFINGTGKNETININSLYIEYILQQYNKNNTKTLNVVFDAGNGATATVLQNIVQGLPGKNRIIYGNVDGTFPNHPADPSIAKNLKDLQKEVLEGGFDLGIAYDGDGDRLAVVDHKGRALYGDQLLCIFAEDYLKDNTGAKVAFEVSSSQLLIDKIKEYGGQPVMCRPGHSFIKDLMSSENIGLAGETSGHMFFGENYNYDDALYASIKLINILENSQSTLSDIVEHFPRYYSTPKIGIACSYQEKINIPQEIIARLQQQGRDLITVNGVRVNKADGWWLIRDNCTEDKITVRCEARTESGLEECKKEVIQQLKLSGINLTF